MIERSKSVSFDHLGLKIRFVVNTESPITALYVKLGARDVYLDADEASQLLGLLLNHSVAIERMKAGVPLSVRKKLDSEELAEE